jgi:hypothetical protein
MNRYTLTEELKEEYIPIVENMLLTIEANRSDYELVEFDLTDTKLNPFTLCELLESLGYTKGEQEESGWQFDFRIPLSKKNRKNIQVSGTGIIFELKLEEIEGEEDFSQKHDPEYYAYLMGVGREEEVPEEYKEKAQSDNEKFKQMIVPSLAMLEETKKFWNDKLKEEGLEQ